MVESKKVNFYTNLIYFVVVVSFVAIRICSSFNLFGFLGTYGSYFLSIFTQIGLLLFLPLLLFKVLTKSKVKETFDFCSYKKVSYKTILMAFVLGAIVFVLNVYVSSFFNSIIQFFGYKPASSNPSTLPATWWVLLLNLLCTAVLPAICEETLHRGLLMNGNSNTGMKKSIIISGLLFGLLHLNIEQFFYASIIGFFLGYICWITCSIYPCMIIHFMNNAISVFLSFARAKGWAIGNVFVLISNFLMKNPFLGFVMFMLILLILFILAFDITKFLAKDAFYYHFLAKQDNLTSTFIRKSYFEDIKNLKNDDYKPAIVEDEKVIHVSKTEFVTFMTEKIGDSIKKNDKFDVKAFDTKLETKSKILLWGSFALAGIITVMTFIWGLL